jgi:23S rRNA U2552 (ribose-2'-O)-methylase RlmE/FtsJ
MPKIAWKFRSPNDPKIINLDNTRRNCLDAMSQIDNLSHSKWHFYRKLLNRHDFVSRHTAVNRAFYKLWEILKQHPLKQDSNIEIKTLHLAEAPGSFVQVVKKMYPRSFNIGISKPPSSYADVVRASKCIPVFSDIVRSLPRTQFFYCDLLNPSIIHDCLHMTSDGFDLITGDGGFDEEKRYDCKETLHYNLILAEIICILFNQKLGGQCVLKIFEVYTDTTLSLLWLLCSHYQTFTFVKPSTSRPTNAERYIVCQGFNGIKYTVQELLQLTKATIYPNMVLNLAIPEQFVRLVVEVSQDLAIKQIQAINDVIKFIMEKTQAAGKCPNSFVYIDKTQHLNQKKLYFNQWKSRYQYDEY